MTVIKMSPNNGVSLIADESHPGRRVVTVDGFVVPYITAVQDENGGWGFIIDDRLAVAKEN